MQAARRFGALQGHHQKSIDFMARASTMKSAEDGAFLLTE
jgi:hypothetical protein